MKTHEKRRKICDSWYHQTWFRFILVIVGIDMIVLGFSFAIGLDITTIITGFGPLLRVIFGSMYMLVALFIIHYALAYKKIKEETHFTCHHCAHAENNHE